MEIQDGQLKWFAARAIREKPFVVRYLDHAGIEHTGIEDIRSLMFIRCSDAQIKHARYELFDRLLIYRGPGDEGPQPVPDEVMKNFLQMKTAREEPLIFLEVTDPALFEGRRKIVRRGIFTGCEGIIKRIKGERRLIVKLNDHAAIATPYIPQEFLEDAE